LLVESIIFFLSAIYLFPFAVGTMVESSRFTYLRK